MEDNVVYILYQSFIFLLRFAKISSCVYLLSSSSADLSASSRAGSTPATAFPHQKTAFYKFIQFLYTDISNTLFITHFCQFGCLVAIAEQIPLNTHTQYNYLLIAIRSKHMPHTNTARNSRL